MRAEGAEEVGAKASGARWVGRGALRRAARGVWRDPSVRAAGFAFVLSRAVVMVIFVLAAHFNTSRPGPDQIVNSHLSLYDAPVWEKTRDAIFTADAYWYAGIATEGYERSAFSAGRPRNWGFFPFYPLALRAATFVVGELVLAGVLLSHLCFFLALVVLYRTAGEFGLDEAASRRTVVYLALSPASYFFSLPLPEALFLLLTVGSIYAGCRGAWPAAGLLGALASATRLQGIFLAPTLLLLYWQRRRGSRLGADVLSVFLVPAGLFAFMLYLRHLTGNALAFKDAMGAPGWGRRFSPFWGPLVEYLSLPGQMIVSWNFKTLHFCAAVLAMAAGAGWLRRREWALGLYTLLSVFIALSSGLLQSGARYMTVVFPIFMWLGLHGRRRGLDETIRAVFVVLLGLLSACFAAHFAMAMS